MSRKVHAILGDIHGNREALEAVLEDAASRGATHYVSVGDIVGYNADPVFCLDKVRELCAACVRGNHDHYCSHDESLEDFHPLAANVVDWTRSSLTEAQRRFLRDLPLIRQIEGYTIVHSTLDMPEKWGYVFDSLDADANFSYQMTVVCFHGHTHIPVVYERGPRTRRRSFSKIDVEVGRKYFVNVGSVGQPRDGDIRAAYVLFDLQNRTMELCRAKYDVAKTQAKIRKANLPERLAKRLELGQ
ncbi:MAG: metallophosphoesterase family protein [Lentisphaerae bacterium]|nr:metallophosphoesterase family protein [Lentisphaerota bacterium]